MKIILLCFILLITRFTFGQDPSFSQSSNNLTYLNPAFTGTAENMRTSFSYRNQWPSISGNYITTNLSVDQYLGKFGGIGVTYIHDLAANTMMTDNVYLDYAYKINVGKYGVVSIGTEVGYIQRSVDWSKLTFGSMINPRRGFVYQTSQPINSKVENVDLGAGVLFYNKVLFAGYGIHHINKPNLSLTGGESMLPMLHSLYIGGMFEIGDFTISPQVDVKAQEMFHSVLGLVKVNYKWMTAGFGLRAKGCCIGYLGFSLNKKVNINYSYDVTVSKLSAATVGAHEVSLQVMFNVLKSKNDKFLRVY